MSSFIPMVSSSPPPMEEDSKSFEWEDDEDFGNFTGANDSATKDDNSETNTNMSSIVQVTQKESPPNDIDFADFKTFNDNIQVSKPNITNLPLVSSIISDKNISSDANKMSESVESLDLSEKNAVQTSLKRDSDSGLFSSDLSPIPVAKETSLVPEDDSPKSKKLNDSSPETPEEMTVSQHENVSKCVDLPVSVENEVTNNLDNGDSNNVETMVDSDEEFDHYSSNVLQSLSSKAAESQSLNPPINSDNNTECDDSIVNKDPSLEPSSNQVPCSLNDDEFGEFTEFSNNALPDQSQNKPNVELPIKSGTESDNSFSNKLEEKSHIKGDYKDCSDPDESDSVRNSDSASENNVIQKEAQDEPSAKQEIFSDNSVGKNSDNESLSNDLIEDEYGDFSSENVKSADVVYVDGSSSDSHNDVTETVSDSTDKLDQSDLKNNYSASEKVTKDDDEEQTKLKNNKNISEANNGNMKHDETNNVMNDNDDDFADFHSARENTANQIKSDSDDDFADFSCAKIKPIEDNQEGFADLSSANSQTGNTSMSSSQNVGDDSDFSNKKSQGGFKTVSPSLDDDDFAEFSSEKSLSQNKTGSLSQDDDDDFADFSSVKSENNSAIKKEMQVLTVQSASNDDDFADFNSANQSNNFANSGRNENDDWGNFSDDQNNDDDEDDDDFGNFSEAATVIKDTAKPVAPNVSKTPGIEKINTVLETCFTRQIQDGHIDNKNCDIIMLDSLLQGSLYTQTTKPLTSQDIIKKVLKHIEDYDNTNALMYSWKKSHSNNRLFNTLKIDTQNMLFGLKKQSVPLSLTGLTLLEPIRGQQDPSKKDRVLANLVEPTSADSIPQLQDMPPVEFDWHNSGLTNPLEAKTLDLDFMVLQENENNAKTRVFQSELLDAPRSSVKPMQPLEDILKNMKSTTMSAPLSETSQKENLSKEADDVIKTLPLLSFMKSKVLMFKLNS